MDYPNLKLRFRRANLGEFHYLTGVLRDAAEWLNIKGMHQWDCFIIPIGFIKQWLYEGYKKGEYFYVEHKGRVAGVFRLSPKDELFWGDEPGDAYYIHSFATSSNYRGFGVGHKMMEWIIKRAKREWKDYIRLDCKKSNPFLQEYYAKYGFEPVRETTVQNDEFILMQKTL